MNLYKKAYILAVMLLLAFLLASCTVSADTSIEYSSADHIEKRNPYLSIIARRQNPDFDEYIWDEVYYLYDLVTNELIEICTLPHFSSYTAGIYSRWENAVYFSYKEEFGTNDRIHRYDIENGKMLAYDNTIVSYNDMAFFDANTLLVIAVTRQGNNVPALIDLSTGEFTYVRDTKGTELERYTNGGQLLSFNFIYDTVPWLYFKDEDRRSDEYHRSEKAIDYHFTLLPLLVSNAYRTFTESFMVDKNVIFLTQITQNEVLVMIDEVGYDERTEVYDDGMLVGGGFTHTYAYYHLVYKDSDIAMYEIENPFHNADYISQCLTFDEGKTYYCRGGFTFNGITYNSSLFIYDTETHSIVPILTDYDDIISVANFRSVDGFIDFAERDFSLWVGIELSEHPYKKIIESASIIELEEEAVYIPNFMKPDTWFLYDENLDIIFLEGGFLDDEEINTREDILEIGYYSDELASPNTKIQYDLNGFLANIYFKWSEDEDDYRLSPPYN